MFRSLVPQWHISWKGNSDGPSKPSIVLYEAPLWRVLGENFFQAIFNLFGEKCPACNAPEFFWKIPLGWPKWDKESFDEPWLENSLGGWIYQVHGRLIFLASEAKRNSHYIDVSSEWAEENGFEDGWKTLLGEEKEEEESK